MPPRMSPVRGRLLMFGFVGALVGSLAPHVAGELFARTGGLSEAAESAHRSLGPGPAIFAISATLLVVAVIRRRRFGRTLPLLLAAIPALVFGLQEWLERMLAVEASPFGPEREPTAVATMIALLPWIVAAYLLARIAFALVRAVAPRGSGAAPLISAGITPGALPVGLSGPIGQHPLLDRPPRAPPSP